MQIQHILITIFLFRLYDLLFIFLNIYFLSIKNNKLSENFIQKQQQVKQQIIKSSNR